MGIGAEKRQCLSPASFSAHRKLAQIRPKKARNPPPGQGCYPPSKEAAQRLTGANRGYFCAEVLWDDATSRRKRMCAFTACVRFLRRRGPAGLRCSFVHLPNRQNLLQSLSRYGTISSTNLNLKGVLNMKFPFYDAPNTATITCCHILENGEPILYVSHDEDDGMWQFLCGKAHETDEAKLVSLKSVFDLDNSVGILKDMPCGYYAERKAQDDEWSVRKR